jgi:hypothetical protein
MYVILKCTVAHSPFKPWAKPPALGRPCAIWRKTVMQDLIRSLESELECSELLLIGTYKYPNSERERTALSWNWGILLAFHLFKMLRVVRFKIHSTMWYLVLPLISPPRGQLVYVLNTLKKIFLPLEGPVLFSLWRAIRVRTNSLYWTGSCLLGRLNETLGLKTFVIFYCMLFNTFLFGKNSVL